MAEQILIDSGPSRRGWSYYSKAFRCLHLHALCASGAVRETREPMTRGSMFHTGVAHLHTRQMCVQTGRDPELFLPPEDAIREWAYRHQEGLPHLGRVLETYRRYVARFPEPPGRRIVGVECEIAGVLGWLDGAWGLWALQGGAASVEEVAPLHTSGRVIRPATLEMPGHRDHGRNVYITRKLDLVIEDRLGSVYVEDYKCLPASARVWHVARGWVTVGALAEEGTAWSCASLENGRVRSAVATAPVQVPRKPVVSWRLGNGMQGRAGEDHPLLTSRGWVPAGEVRKGDRVAVALARPCPWDAPLSDAFLTVAGLLICDGSENGEQIQFHKRDSRTIDHFCNALGRLGMGPGDFSRCVSKLGKGIVSIRTRALADAGLGGIVDAHSPERSLPAWVDGLSARQIRVLLGALWEGDGAVYLGRSRPGSTTRKVVIAYACRSERLSAQIQDLCLRVGLTASRCASGVTYRKVRLPYFNVAVVGNRSKRAFLGWGISGEMPMPVKREGGKRTRAGNRNPPLAEVLAHVPEANASSGFAVQEDGAVWWVPVRTLEVLPTETLYAIHVPGPENFVAEGLVTHNCKAMEVYDSTARKYAMSGEFAVSRILASQVWPRFRGLALWMVQTCDPWKVAKPAVPESPWRDRLFPRELWRMAHVIAQLERDEPDPHGWPMAQNEVSCVGRYEKEGCPAMEMCMRGPQ